MTDNDSYKDIGNLKTLIKEAKVKPTIKEKSHFKCRICGNTEYQGVYGNTSLVPLGGTAYPIAYQCCGCSVIFRDILKFSTQQKLEVNI